MSDGGRRDSAKLELHAYQDGELPLWRRWRVARRLARDAAAQREVAAIEALRTLLREQAATLPEPDLWEGVRAQLPTAARPASLDVEEARPAQLPWLPAWLGAGIAAASVALVMASGVLSGDAAPVGSLRWLDSKGKPVMVLRDDHDATIIWVLDKPKRAAAGVRDAMA
jgi:anti-sigma factor RsiW